MRVIKGELHEEVYLPNRVTCPYCGGSMNTASSANTDELQDGDYGICVGCAEVCITVIDNEGTYSLRRATQEDIDFAKGSSMYNLILEYQELLRSKNHGLKIKK